MSWQICKMQIRTLLIYLIFFLLLYSTRLSKAIENLQHFTLAADPSFRHFQLDVTKELKLLTELNFIQGEKKRRGGFEDFVISLLL